MGELHCIGCGSLIQTDHEGRIGFIPLLVLTKNLRTGELYCQRCFQLRHYNKNSEVQVSNDVFASILHEIETSHALVVYVIDIFNFNGSFLPSLSRFLVRNNILLVGNKIDIFSRTFKMDKVIRWLSERVDEEKFRPCDIILTSSKNKTSIQTLIDKIDEWRMGRDSYFIGVANVGKSTLINEIIDEVRGNKHLITTSRFPGTTLDRIGVDLDDGSHIYDTPGFTHHRWKGPFLSQTDFKYTTPTKAIRPRTYQLNPGQTLFVGGFGKFDFIKGERQSFTAYFDNRLKIHRTKLAGSTTFYRKHLGRLLIPPISDELADFPNLVQHKLNVVDKTDVVFSGFGWIRVSNQAVIEVYTLEGMDVVFRKAIV